MSLENELKELIIRELKIEDLNPAELTDDVPLFGEGIGLDSLDAVELVVILQKRFQVDLKDMEEAKTAFTSIKTLADYVRKYRDNDDTSS